MLLKRARLDQGLDPYELAYKINLAGGPSINAQTVERVEGGGGSLKNALRMATALGVRVRLVQAGRVLKTN